MQGIGFNSVGRPNGAKGTRWGNTESVTRGSHYQPRLEGHREEVMLPDPGDAYSGHCWRPEATPLPNSLSSLLQLLKALWLHFAAGTLDRAGVAAASNSPHGQKALKPEPAHCRQKQEFLAKKVNFSFSFSFPISCQCLFMEELSRSHLDEKSGEFNFQCFRARI